MISARASIAQGLLLGLLSSLSACLEVPARLYACAPDGGCPEGFGCGADNLCISEDVLRDAGAVDAVVPACSASVGQLLFQPRCSTPQPGCGTGLDGTWCTTGACAPLLPFPVLDQLCRENGVSASWSGHTGTVRGGRVYVSDGGTRVFARRDERVELSVDVALSGPCVPGGDCVDTASSMQLAHPGLTAVCTEQGQGCQCVLRWSQLSLTVGEVELGLGEYSDVSGGEAWKVCARPSALELAPVNATPAFVYAYEQP
ncbi:MAG: hypothetical protein RL653_3878 [Pseudomonadota bacterium]